MTEQATLEGFIFPVFAGMIPMGKALEHAGGDFPRIRGDDPAAYVRVVVRP